MTMNELTQTPRSRVKRLPKRAHYDFDTVAGVLDAGFMCHVGYVIDGKPYVTPTSYWREGDHVYWHGSSASRMLRTVAGGVECCLTVAHVDGLVLARSAFHHSINYRSVVILGKATLVDDVDEKNKALEAFTEHVVPGRWADVRWPTELELKATSVLKLPIDEASAKVRIGDPKDDDEDYAMDIWAGVLPLSLQTGKPVDDSNLTHEVDPPKYITEYSRRVK